MDSRQVTWFETYTYAERLAAGYGITLDHHLIPGTPQWCGMPDNDARKLLALILGGVRDALRNDTHQTALADASREISASHGRYLVEHDRLLHRRGGSSYIPRRRSSA